jgi:hypothetical protein
MSHTKTLQRSDVLSNALRDALSDKPSDAMSVATSDTENNNTMTRNTRQRQAIQPRNCAIQRD